MKSNLGRLPTSYRLAITSRVMAAVLGGYLVATLASLCVTLLLPLPRAEAVLSGLMISFLFYLVAVLWCFACRTAWQAWLGLLVPSALMAVVAALTYGLGQS